MSVGMHIGGLFESCWATIHLETAGHWVVQNQTPKLNGKLCFLVVGPTSLIGSRNRQKNTSKRDHNSLAESCCIHNKTGLLTPSVMEQNCSESQSQTKNIEINLPAKHNPFSNVFLFRERSAAQSIGVGWGGDNDLYPGNMVEPHIFMSRS